MIESQKLATKDVEKANVCEHDRAMRARVHLVFLFLTGRQRMKRASDTFSFHRHYMAKTDDDQNLSHFEAKEFHM